MTNFNHITDAATYYAQYGRLIAFHRTYVECAWMTLTGAERPIGIPEMLRDLGAII